MAVRAVPDPEGAPRPGGTDTLGRRAADAGDRADIDDAAEAADPGRADAGAGAGNPGAVVEGNGKIAADNQYHRAAGRAECYLRPAACRPGIRDRTLPHRMGR